MTCVSEEKKEPPPRPNMPSPVLPSFAAPADWPGTRGPLGRSCSYPRSQRGLGTQALGPGGVPTHQACLRVRPFILYVTAIYMLIENF